MIYLDSETCGLTGPMVLFQYAEDDGDIKLYQIWNEPISRTLELFEYICTQEICGFNLSFDWFHVNKIYNILRVLSDNGHSGIPTIDAVATVEQHAPAKWCLKPKAPLDIMLYARRTSYQHTMGRRKITIRKVPTIIADRLAEILKQEVPLPAIAFAKRPNGYQWEVSNLDDLDGLSDIHLRFAGSSSLRTLSHDILDEDKADWPIPKNIIPTEKSWHPYGQHGTRPWIKVIYYHIAMWEGKKAQYYAWKDVDLTRKLRYYFSDAQAGDTDSILACSIGASRWRGFEINHNKIDELVSKYKSIVTKTPTSPAIALRILKQSAGDTEKLFILNTLRTTLEHLEKYGSNEKLRDAAKLIKETRQAQYRLRLLTRLGSLPKLHPDFKVIGTKSNRQSGGSEGKNKGSINPQGIPASKEIRQCFNMHDPETEELHGGDAKSFEITIMDAVFPDPVLHDDLISGKNFHALMGYIWYGIPYNNMIQQKSISGNETKYYKAKQADFAFIYGAQQDKLTKVLGLEEEEVFGAMQRFQLRYPQLYRKREQTALQFCSMKQPGGIGTKVVWQEAVEYAESLFGFKRYFTIENSICKKLFEIANKPSKFFTENEISSCRHTKVIRRTSRGSQTKLGALQSALYAAAFQLQAANMRAGCNHMIQSPGGHITKEFQRELTDLQPIGINPWICRTFNMHDELIVAVAKGTNTKCIKDSVINKFRKDIPLLDWEWNQMSNWSNK